jgi:phytoene dehydrogenase-like protein
VIGSGPNGLAAAITLARAGLRVTVHEAASTPGGGTRSSELTLPGFVHDVCSSVHPLALSSPFFRGEALPLEWVYPPAAVAHALDGGDAVVLERSIDKTAEGLGHDGAAWKALFSPFVPEWLRLTEDVLAPPGIPHHPLLLARFGMRATASASSFARRTFRGARARALFAGLAAHSFLPLDVRPSAAFGLVLGISAHAVGWPVARGGSQRIAEAMVERLRTLGGEVRTSSRIDRLPGSGLVLCDVTPRQFLALAGDRAPSGYRSALDRFRYGPGAFKVDWALDGPVPWAAPGCARAATVHLGGTLEEVEASERGAWDGRHNDRPFVLFVQAAQFDASRAPVGRQTAWAYCHVPHGSREDMTERIERQVERFAPGFSSRILARHTMGPAELESYNPNLVGGDINGGAATLRQLFLRPTWSAYTTPIGGVYLCSASTPPGGGVHGMCGYHAARRALR